MKQILIALGAVVCLGVGGMVGVMAATSTPEIDRANSTFQLSGNLTPTGCPGEDSIGYVTFHGTYTGGETQVLPDPTDYKPLTGKVTVSGIAWTINLKTMRGVLTGAISLVNSAGAPVYKGSLTLITQGVPSSSAPVPGRGWIVAKFIPPDEGATATADDNLLANTEWKLGTSAAFGQFGDAAGGGTLGYKDFSVATNVAPTALDGVC